MNNDLYVPKLSFFRKRRLLRDLKKGIVPEDVSEQKTLLVDLSAKQLDRFFSSTNQEFFTKFAEDAVKHALIQAQTEEKFAILAKLDKKKTLAPACEEIIKNGDEKAILIMLSSPSLLTVDIFAQAFINNSVDFLLSYFDIYQAKYKKTKLDVRFQSKDLLSIWAENNRADLLLALFDKLSILSAFLVDVLLPYFDNPTFAELRKKYLEVGKFSAASIKYYVETSTPEEFKLLLERHCGLEPHIFRAVLEKDSPDYMVIFIQYLNQQSLSFSCIEEQFVTSKYRDALKLYLPNRRLSLEATHRLIDMDDEELISLYLNEGNLNNYDIAAIEQMLVSRKSKLQKRLLPLSYAQEVQLITGKNQEDLLEYIRDYYLDSVNEALLMKSGNTEAITLYLKTYELSDIGMVSLFKYGREDMQTLFFEENIGIKLSSKAEPVFILHGALPLVEEYIKKFDLSIDSVSALYKRENFGLLKSYFSRHAELTSQDAVLLAEKCSGDFVLQCIKLFYDEMDLNNYHNACAISNFQKSILKNRPILAEDIINLHSLSDEAIKILIGHSSERLILYYIERYPLPDAMQVELIKMNNQTLWKAYTAKYPLCVRAENLLIDIY